MVMIPKRSGGGARRQAVSLPDAGDVATVRAAGDPGVSAPEGAFGGGTGDFAAAAADISDTFAKVAQKQRTREDGMRFSRSVNKFTEDLSSSIRDWQTEADITDPSAVDPLGEKFNDLESRYLAENKDVMGPDSFARLTARLGDIKSHFTVTSAEIAVTTQRTAATEHLSGSLSNVISQGGDIKTQFDTIDSMVSDVEGVFSKPQEDEFKANARRDVMLGLINQSFAKGDHQAARMAFESAGKLNVTFSPDKQREITRNLITAEHQSSKFERETNERLGVIANIYGVDDPNDLPVNLKLAAAKISLPQGKATPADMISSYEDYRTKVDGVPYTVTPDEARRAFKFADKENSGPFGSGLSGRALSIMTEGAPAFAAGIMPPDEERLFIAAATEYGQPSSFPNPDTGVMQTKTPVFPAFVPEAFQRRGMEMPGAAPNDNPEPREVADNISAPVQDGGRSLWEMASDATGPVPAIAEAVGRVPIVGDLVPSSRMTQARTSIPLMQNDLVRVLQNNPRYAEGERQAIKKETSIDPSIFDTPTAYRNRLTAIDDALEIRQRNALQTANNPNVGRDERVQAMNVLNGLTQFRSRLGVPIRIKSVDALDALDLPVGTQFILDGRVGEITGKAEPKSAGNPVAGRGVPDPAARGNEQLRVK